MISTESGWKFSNWTVRVLKLPVFGLWQGRTKIVLRCGIHNTCHSALTFRSFCTLCVLSMHMAGRRSPLLCGMPVPPGISFPPIQPAHESKWAIGPISCLQRPHSCSMWQVGDVAGTSARSQGKLFTYLFVAHAVRVPASSRAVLLEQEGAAITQGCALR